MNHSPQHYLAELSEITTVILSPEMDYIALKENLDSLSSLFLKVSKLNMDADINAEHLLLPAGKAIGLKWAAMCIEDMVRTKRFISGIHRAILDKQKLKKNSPIQILYTGCGPFATLLMPLITQFTSEEIQITCLEVNAISIQSLKNVMDAMDAQAYFKAIHHCDATSFRLPDSELIDIVVIEVLQLALTRESQVAITYNLIPQLPKSVTLIPEEITLHVAFIDTKKQDEHRFKADPNLEIDYLAKIGEVFTLNKESALANITPSSSLTFPEVEILFPKDLLKDKTSAVILTEIQVYGSYRLDFWESGLTIPTIFADLSHEKELIGVKTQYIANNDPYLNTTLIRKSPR